MNNSILTHIRKSKAIKAITALTIVNFIGQMVLPTAAYALTSGPSQPEVQSFEPVGTTQMVDLFTGDFTYNIPLFELPGPNGGYPFNIAYHSGIGMDQEASWVGLGWNLNPGAIVRTKRGLPDDFHGDNDKITRTVHMKPSHTVSAGVGGTLELFGASSDQTFTADLRVYYNNYKGVGYSLNPSFGVGVPGAEGLSGGFGFSLSSDEGVGVDANVSLAKAADNLNAAIDFGGGFQSRSGLNLSLGMQAYEKFVQNGKDKYRPYAVGGNSTFSFSQATHSPAQQFGMDNTSLAVSVKTGLAASGSFGGLAFSGSYSTQEVQQNGLPVKTPAYGYNYLEGAGDYDLMDFNREKDGLIRKETPNLAVPNLTFDYYNIQGQGTGGMFRPYRSEIGSVHDPEINSTTSGGSIGFDAGVGPGAHSGASGNYTGGNSYSGKWRDDNPMVQSGNPHYVFRGADEASEKGNGLHPDYSAAYEPFYYKVYGEHTSFKPDELDHIGGEGPVRIALEEDWDGLRRHFDPSTNLLQGNTQTYTNQSWRRSTEDAERLPRSKNVQAPTNNNLLDVNNVPVLGEFDVYYYGSNQTIDDYDDAPGTAVTRHQKTFTVNSAPAIQPTGNHSAGFSILGEDGLRHVYGLPAYNIKEAERVFSVSPSESGICGPTVAIQDDDGGADGEVDYEFANTNEFFSKTETPPYAHSYLLTSVLGADYVDADNTPGPSDGDYGYWVKLEYAQPNSGLMKWRAPFLDANYIEGLETSGEDNQGTFVYGEKELYFLAKAETKTHVAIFHTSPREDALGPNKMLNGLDANEVDLTNRNYKLDSIGLYERIDFYTNYGATTDPAVPIKTIHMEYDYSLCPFVPNNSGESVKKDGGQVLPATSSLNVNANEGKLTLRKLWFTYQQNDRGALSPYVFDYSTTNPAYSQFKLDRWGNYKSKHDGNTIDACANQDYPYVEQFNRNLSQIDTEKTAFRNGANTDASAWHLTTIDLPTGSTLNIDYEADDYAHVQHKRAAQMFKVAALGDCNASTSNGNMDIPSPKNPSADDRRVYFDLEHPISTLEFSAPGAAAGEVERQYSDGTGQLYYKIKNELRGDKFEYISGYLDIESWGAAAPCSTVLNLDGSGASSYYVKGFVTLAEGQTRTDFTNPQSLGTCTYHPFAEAAWQHMRANNMRMMMAIGDLSAPTGSSKQVRQEKVQSLAGSVTEIVKMFTGYQWYCNVRGFGNAIKPSESWIRLGTPDGIKLGGGTRVAALTITDGWDIMTGNTELLNTYGQHYDYTTTDEAGRVISSGVAQYEPLIGGDEIALRYARKYKENIPLMTNNNLFFQFPINESYFPGAGVGYGKVTVKSKATDEVMITPPTGSLTTSTGITVNEFYTAKDFPVITNETAIAMKPVDRFIPIPLVGQIKGNKITASQGYSIELNDMHGKPHKITNYGLDKNAVLNPNPISSVEYVYHSDIAMYNGNEVLSLENEVPVIAGDGVDAEQRLVGVEYEFFTDQRQSRSTSTTGGLTFNGDLMPVVGGIPTIWPMAVDFTQDLRQIVTNKVIHKTGLLKKTIATDGQSTIETENKLYDALTGQPLLTTVTNKYQGLNGYDKPIYSYNYPAHWNYDGMGAAYQNHGFTFGAATGNVNGTTGVFDLNLAMLTDQNGSSLTPVELAPYLVPGDEFIISDGTNALGTATLLESYSEAADYTTQGTGLASQVFRFHTDVALSTSTSTALNFVNVRSGRRNHLTTSSGEIQSLQDPTSKTVIGGTVTADITQEMVDFLNSILTCEGQLPEKDYVLTGKKYYDQDGNQLLPNVSELVSVLRIAACNTNNWSGPTLCSNCQYSAGGFPPIGYEIALMIPGSNEFNEEIHCIARKQDDTQVPVVITGFTAGNNTIETTYETYPATSACVDWELPIPNSSTSHIKEVLNASAVEFRDFWNHDFEASAGESCNGVTTNDNNLYAVGKKGIWRPYKNYYYKDDRVQSSGGIGRDLANDGVYVGTGVNHLFKEFVWCPSYSNPLPASWIPNQIITKYNTDGFEVENRDISGIYSAAKYGYNGNLATAVGANMRQDQFFFESFDDATTPYLINGSFGPYEAQTGLAHTGDYAMVLTGEDDLEFKKVAKAISGQKFHVSAWTAAATSITSPTLDYYQQHTYDLDAAPLCVGCTAVVVGNSTNTRIDVKFYASNGFTTIGNPISITPVGEIIDGWQKVEGDIDVPIDPNIRYIGVQFHSGQYTDVNNNNTVVDLIKAWDDIRLFPFDGNMQSYVYDRDNYRLRATLDQNNYATIYNYDEEGNLFLVKKETTKGIMTVQESRSHTALIP